MAGLLSRLISDRDPLLLSAVALVSINSAAHLLASLTKDRKVHDVFTTGSLVASAATSLGGELLPCVPHRLSFVHRCCFDFLPVEPALITDLAYSDGEEVWRQRRGAATSSDHPHSSGYNLGNQAWYASGPKRPLARGSKRFKGRYFATSYARSVPSRASILTLCC